MSHLDEECKGCLTAFDPDQNTYTCYISPRYKSLEYPCLTCIIKGVCKNDCELIKDYFTKTQIYRK